MKNLGQPKKQKRNLSTWAADELRTPAHAILGFAELAMMESNSENGECN